MGTTNRNPEVFARKKGWAIEMTTKDRKMMEQGEPSGIHKYSLISNLYMSIKWMKEGGGERDPYTCN